MVPDEFETKRLSLKHAYQKREFKPRSWVWRLFVNVLFCIGSVVLVGGLLAVARVAIHYFVTPL